MSTPVAVLTSPRPADPWITCVVPAFNEAEGIIHFLECLSRQMATMVKRFDIIVIDDGSADNTAEVVAASGMPRVRLIRLSRNFGKESALSAGIDHAEGDAVILIDADFQHPLDMLPVFFSHWHEGYDMVYGLRDNREDESPLKQKLTAMFYKIMAQSASVPIIPNAGDFRLLDRKVVHALRSLPERTRFMKGLYAWVGFRSLGIPFVVEQRRSGSTSFNFRRLSELAITGITSFSDVPLRVWGIIGAAISGISILYAMWEVAKTLIYGVDLPGWATLTVGIMFLGGVQLLSIGILGEYIGRIFTEVKQRPRYVIGCKHGFDDDSQGGKP